MPDITPTPGMPCILFHPTKLRNIWDRGIQYSHVPDGITWTAHVNNRLLYLQVWDILTDSINTITLLVIDKFCMIVWITNGIVTWLMRIPFFTVLRANQLICFIANDSPSLPPHISARSNGFCHCTLRIIPTKVSHRVAQNRNSIEIMSLFCGMCTRCNSEDRLLEGIEDYWITTPPSTSTDINMEMIRQHPSMYSRLLTESAYEELEENCTTELFNAFTVNLADDTPALTRVRWPSPNSAMDSDESSVV